jgi:putative cobalt transporter subunit CbtB
MNDRHFDLLKKVLLPIRNAVRKGNRLYLLTAARRSYDDKIDLEGNSVERMLNAWLGLAVSEPASFFIKSSIFLFACGATLFFALGASYPALHDTLHNVRHALAVVPCH